MKITNDNYVDEAEKAIKSLGEKYKDRKGKSLIVSTTKIRNILAMTADIYNDAVLLEDDNLTEALKDKLTYLRVRCLYESGRDKNVKNFIEEAQILENMKEIKTRKDYILFSHYMESLVAWRKYKYEEKE